MIGIVKTGNRNPENRNDGIRVTISPSSIAATCVRVIVETSKPTATVVSTYTSEAPTKSTGPPQSLLQLMASHETAKYNTPRSTHSLIVMLVELKLVDTEGYRNEFRSSGIVDVQSLRAVAVRNR